MTNRVYAVMVEIVNDRGEVGVVTNQVFDTEREALAAAAALNADPVAAAILAAWTAPFDDTRWHAYWKAQAERTWVVWVVDTDYPADATVEEVRAVNEQQAKIIALRQVGCDASDLDDVYMKVVAFGPYNPEVIDG